ncbi:hypothetical protein OHA21_48995 [Actinoplanes sp. NBC_00393]|uniref:hypothetical protein n=1 Tax=Actinoplanes sp. NBC_00393 TaxID=2975953 RepID=UPI002E1EED37
MKLSKSLLGGVTALGVALAAPPPASAAETSWRVTSASLPQLSRLQDVTATGPSAAWAVGYQNHSFVGVPAGLQFYAVMRWNGSRWAQEQLPGDPSNLTGVSAAGNADVWTVGHADEFVPYAAHFNGRTWTNHRPLGDDRFATLNDVAARAGRAVFVGSKHPNPKIVEWDGQRFTDVAVTVPDSWSNGLYSVSTASDGVTSAVGETYRADGSGPYPLALQRRNGAWRVMPMPDIVNARLLSVAARSANDVWAVGTIDDSYTRQPLIMHFNGQSWRQIAAPVSNAPLQTVAVDAGGTVWIAGHDETRRLALYLSYRAGRWTVERGTGDLAISGLAAIPGTTGGFWGVGTDGTGAVIARRG